MHSARATSLAYAGIGFLIGLLALLVIFAVLDWIAKRKGL